MNPKCEVCIHKIACRRTKRACHHFQEIDIRMDEYDFNKCDTCYHKKYHEEDVSRRIVKYD